MFQVAGHIYPVGEIDMPRTERPLMVTACGHIVVANQGIISTARPEGRRDYQLLYVHSGLAYYMLHGKEQKLSAGQMIFYHPMNRSSITMTVQIHPMHTGSILPEMMFQGNWRI